MQKYSKIMPMLWLYGNVVHFLIQSLFRRLELSQYFLIPFLTHYFDPLPHPNKCLWRWMVAMRQRPFSNITVGQTRESVWSVWLWASQWPWRSFLRRSNCCSGRRCSCCSGDSLVVLFFKLLRVQLSRPLVCKLKRETTVHHVTPTRTGAGF